MTDGVRDVCVEISRGDDGLLASFDVLGEQIPEYLLLLLGELRLGKAGAELTYGGLPATEKMGELVGHGGLVTSQDRLVGRHDALEP